ncbi:hypothetical protein ZOSMA_356G00150 [Zostera marina]|uniref:Uncharacterized protein n=1 Tax=Zostera marina TaxID=29655 RepID=A0A0K9P928_ZOSMR|nr:hypothetical protein ZOSMA_356G00150 [Zostera marina]
MSWLRSAVSKAVEVGGRNNITRTVKSYADTVVLHAGQAVSEGAKIIQERMGPRNFKSFKQTVKRLEEVAVSCNGLERTQLLKRWLFALKEIERVGDSLDERNLEQGQNLPSDDSNPSSKSVPMVLYFDSDMEGEPMNFRDVFLHSQALECIILSMILDPPTNDEVSLLLEIFRYSITGGKEVHYAIISSIQDLSKVFSNYEDEVLVKRDELLQFAQSAITGLKLNVDVARIDAEASTLCQKVDELGALQYLKSDNVDNAPLKTTPSLEALIESLADIRVCSKLEALLLKKKSINTGDSQDIHSQKVDKLKILSESLASYSMKAEKRISDHRQQKEEALNFRLVKTKEVSDADKELSAEIAGLEKQRDDLEAELKKVNISLSAANSRLKKSMEEREQFDEASNRMVKHFIAKENDLSRSMVSCKVESDVVRTWINFLEDTRLLQSTYSEQTEKQTNDDLEKYGNSFVKLVSHHLLPCKEVLTVSISRIRNIVENMRELSGRSEITASTDALPTESNPHLYIEEEYLKVETKIITTFSLVGNMKKLFCLEKRNAYRGDHSNIDKLFEDIEKMREEFESIERPTLSLETPPQREIPPTQKFQPTVKTNQPWKSEGAKSPKLESKKAVSTSHEQLDHEAELALLESEIGEVGEDYSTEIGGWEFDELEQELKKSGDLK